MDGHKATTPLHWQRAHADDTQEKGPRNKQHANQWCSAGMTDGVISLKWNRQFGV